ncbi:WRKY transcription factor 44 isoform X2 [Malania oleifera]|uniref:WRKY transcription factor 44 isoform X2 n=1 Tax=Malania oleifera TaxID=397392 RepID=UPI0025AEC119|nr:WRKY transcription factor 44 isoform X2 [Malania oleifera]XP_057981980.1 WRKY transcription factor 44 isoform X2 [Malania oleifera]XP_057981982.1 WRKY transcription factor 44 isoform X2 [Malania oleifera]
MEIKEAERIVIAKPVASRPTCSSFRSFSELLAGAINASPSNACSETAVPAIRPKTMRFKPVLKRAPVGVVSSQAEITEAACCSANKVLKQDSKSTVVYKPLAKLVSKTTASFLANLGNSSHQQALAHVEALAQHPNEDKHHLGTHLTSNRHPNNPPLAEIDQIVQPSKVAMQNLEDDQKHLPPTTNGDRPSYDGYNWRKYGQKQVKGSEFPRSYYKCTHPNCPVKKKVERSLDGQIAEIVYKGEHNHSKPQPPKRNSSGAQAQGFVLDGTGQDTSKTLNNNTNERNEGSEGGVENLNDIGLSSHSTYAGKAQLSYDPVSTGAPNAGVGNSENSCGLSGDCEEGSKEADDDEPNSKRRKSESQSNEAVASGEGVQEPRIVVQSSTDSEILGDGFRWRKYGQKVVKGNPYPRHVNYKC